MKRNKLAAGALALALGLSAVAPSFAADTTSTKTEVKSTTLFQEKYAEELKVAQELYAEASEQKEAYDAARVKLAEAKTRVEKAAKDYNAISVNSSDATLKSELNQARRALAQLAGVTPKYIEDLETVEAKEATEQKVEIKYSADGSKIEEIKFVPAKSATEEIVAPAAKKDIPVIKDVPANASIEDYSVRLNEDYNANAAAGTFESYKYLAAEQKAGDDVAEFEFYTDNSKTATTKLYVTNNEEKAATANWKVNEATTKEQTQREYAVAYQRYVNAWNLYHETITNNLSAKDAAYQELIAAERAYDVAKTAYDAAKPKYDDALGQYNKALAKLKAAADSYNVVIVATNNGIEVKGEKEAPAKKDVDYVGLQAAIDRANETLRAVELLEKLTPNTAANNRAKLNALVAEQKATIAKAEAILKAADKKVALVATAYAAEEEVTAEDVDALIKELDDNTDAIQKELKDLDKDVKVEDEKPADDDKKDDKKPADEDKKDDDKKEDKADDKKEDKADDKKVDTTKVVNKSANKTAGSNAKTGIAGVAGVAGVLAAASVAYAASKKNN